MPGVSLEVIIHRLNMDPTYHLMKQKKINFTSNHSQSIDEEFANLLEADFIHKVQYPEWLANVALVKKASEK